MWKTSVVVAPANLVNAPAPLKGDIATTIRQAADIGFDAVQLTIARPAEFDRAAAANALDECRMRVSSIATGGGYSIDGICLGHRDDIKRLAAVTRIKEHIDLAAALGKPRVVLGLIRGRFADGGTPAEYMRRYTASVEACVAHAADKDIVLVHEAIGRTDSDVLRTIAENLAFIDSFASRYLKLQIDTHHLALEETDFHRAIIQAGARLAQVDISDIERKVPDGKHFDFPRLLDALRRADYRGDLVFEYNAQGDGLEEARAGLAYMRSIMASKPAAPVACPANASPGVPATSV